MDTDSIVVVGKAPGVHQVWAWKNVVVVSWSGKPTGEATRMFGPISDRLLEQLGVQKLSYVHLVPNGLELPDAATRSAFLDLTREYGDRTACVAVVVNGIGFWASAIRGFATGIRVVAPRTVDFRLHSEISELVEWFPEEHERRTGVRLNPSELLRALERVQSAHHDAA